MLELLFTPKAIFDLECIYEYTLSTWGRIQADKYHDELYVELEKISKFSHLGKEYQYTQLNYRYYLVNRHYVFYRIEGKHCIIIRILHENMFLDSSDFNMIEF